MKARPPISTVPKLAMFVALAVVCGGGVTQAQSPAEALAAFHEALATGDSVGALALLAEDAVIFESGGTEDKDHYRSGHLAADIRFARATDRTATVVASNVTGDIAWILSETHTTGSMGEREIDSRGVETAVLRHTSDGWRITHLHWSARRR